MSVIPFQEIQRRLMFHSLLSPYELNKEVHKATGLSYGCGACTYDVRIRENLMIPPKGFELASTLEKFYMPSDLVATVHDKSSLVRLGLHVNNTLIDPGWQGYLTLELVNNSSSILSLIAGQPIAQIKFETLTEPTDRPYAGKYQDQPAEPVPMRKGLVE